MPEDWKALSHCDSAQRPTRRALLVMIAQQSMPEISKLISRLGICFEADEAAQPHSH